MNSFIEFIKNMKSSKKMNEKSERNRVKTNQFNKQKPQQFSVIVNHPLDRSPSIYDQRTSQSPKEPHQ